MVSPLTNFVVNSSPGPIFILLGNKVLLGKKNMENLRNEFLKMFVETWLNKIVLVMKNDMSSLNKIT